MPSAELLQQANHIMTICNACRYCEGLCAVFPAMERRRTFNASDLVFLANLCHNCRGCYYDCQYAPPHEFDVNVPKTFSQLRSESYAAFAWPNALSGVFKGNGVKVSWVLAVSLLVALTAGLALVDRTELFGQHSGDGAFYEVVPYWAMVGPALAITLLGGLAMLMGLARFWSHSGGTLRDFLNVGAHRAAIVDAMTLRNLGGGGAGCHYPSERLSSVRRRFHHWTFYGFLLSFASTTVAAVYENLLGWPSPYPYLSLPVVLGTVGGIGLCIGTTGLLVLARRRDEAPEDTSLRGMDTAFLFSLFLTSITGLVLMVLRESSAMGLLLVIHLGAVLGLFVTIPYGKFVHGIYRYAALVLDQVERRRAAA